MKLSLLLNMRMPTKVGISIFISRKQFHAQLSITRNNLHLSIILVLLVGQTGSGELSMKKSFITSKPGLSGLHSKLQITRGRFALAPCSYLRSSLGIGIHDRDHFAILNSARAGYDICLPLKQNIW